jgi:tetratricopeptide (TPR) repeat protein
MKRQRKRPANEPALAVGSSRSSVKVRPPDGGVPQPQASRPWPWVLGFLLIAATFLAYLPALHGGFIWDDDDYVTDNKLLTAPDGLKRIWFSLDSPSQYFPLTYTTFRIERALWGLNPTGYHFVNLLLHVVNALLVWRLLSRLSVPGAWLAAAIFALHPVQVESVAWITERKNVLSLFFFLLSLLSWVEFVKERPGRRWRFYFMALMFCALALFSKTTACTLPVALLLVLWLKGKPISRSRLVQVVPFVTLGVGLGLVTMWWERYHQGTEGRFFGLGWQERVLLAGRAVWFYAGKLVWPANLTFSYPRWTIDAADPLAYGWLVAGGGLCAVIYFARRWVGRSVEVAVAFFVATLGPMLGFIMLATFKYSFVADHYQYVASIGLFALAAAASTMAFGFLRGKRPFLEPALCGILLLVLGVLTWRQCGMYANLETLWRTTIARNPDCWMAHNNLGVALAARGNLPEAVQHYERALQLKPDYTDAYYNLGNALATQGKVAEAIQHYERALQLEPDYAEVHCNLGNALATQGKLAEAIQHYERALQLKPDDAEAHCSLGAMLATQDKLAEAIQHFEQALRLKPDYAEAHCNLGVALASQGKSAEAILHFQQALALATAQGNAMLAESIRTRLRSYQPAMLPPQTP